MKKRESRPAIGVFISKKISYKETQQIADFLVSGEFTKFMKKSPYDVFVIGGTSLPLMMFNQDILKGLTKKAKDRDRKLAK